MMMMMMNRIYTLGSLRRSKRTNKVELGGGMIGDSVICLRECQILLLFEKWF
jgi:hypothetical protein